MRLCTANNFRVTEKLQNCAMDTGRGNDLLHRSGYATSPWHPQQVLEPATEATSANNQIISAGRVDSVVA